MSSTTCNVQVVVRCRPFNDAEKTANMAPVVACNSIMRSVEIKPKRDDSRFASTVYTYDEVFGMTASQGEVYHTAVAPLVEEMLKGFNCTVFAYGQTGTGKTYTMEGLRDRGRGITEETGIIARAVGQIFETLTSQTVQYTIRVSAMEIYNEELRDMLSDSNEQLKIFDDSRRGVQVHGLKELHVHDQESILSVLDRISEQRHTAETKLNKWSSRSHCIFTITIHTKESTNLGEDVHKKCKLHLVDLAGSECIGRSGAEREHAREAGQINRSLLALGRVITNLTTGASHIPYRGSKLTRILQDSLGGHTKTCIIANISPSQLDQEETIRTLSYAFSAKRIENQPDINVRRTKREVFKEYAKEMERLKEMLQATRNKLGVYLPQERYDDMEALLKSQKEDIQELEARIQHIKDEFLATMSVFEEEQEKVKQVTVECDETTKILNETNATLEEIMIQLKKTKEELEERETVLRVYQETENVMTEQAKVIYGAVDAARSDIGGLFAKIERQSSTETENNKATVDYAKIMKDQTEVAQKELAQFCGEQTSLLQILANSARAFVTTTTSELDATSKQLEDLLHTIGNRQKEAETSTSSYIYDTHENNSAMIHDLENTSTNESTIVETFQDDMMATFSSIQSDMDVYREGVAEFIAITRAHVSDGMDAMQAFAKVECEGLNQLENQISSDVVGQTQQLQEHLNDVDSFMHEHTSRVARENEALLEHIGTLVSEHFAKQQAETIQAVQVARNILAQRQMAATQFRDASISAVEAMSSASSSFLLTRQEHTEAGLSAVDRYIQDSQDFLPHKEQQIETKCTAVKDLAAQINEIMDRTCEQTESFAQKSCEGAISYTTQHQICLENMQCEGLSVRDNLFHQLDDVNEGFIEQSRNWINQLQENRQCVDEYADTAATMTQHLHSTVNKFFKESVQASEITGNTPTKREVRVPTQLVQARPEENIVAEVRRKRNPPPPPSVVSTAASVRNPSNGYASPDELENKVPENLGSDTNKLPPPSRIKRSTPKPTLHRPPQSPRGTHIAAPPSPRGAATGLPCLRSPRQRVPSAH